jgi:ribosome recycling factor
LTHSFPQKLPSRCLSAPRNFSQTSIAYKKGGKAAREEKNSSAAEKSSAVEDPNDFSTLEAGIQKTLTRLQDELSKLRTGGRFNPELLEGVRVQLKKDNKQSIRLGDLAQVVPKGGKSIVVFVGEADVSGII